MELNNLLKAIIYFGIAIFMLGILVIVSSSITNSSAWDVVPDGFAKYLAILLPLILLIGFFIKAIQMATKSKDRE
jgi:Na+/serine symporter